MKERMKNKIKKKMKEDREKKARYYRQGLKKKAAKDRKD